MHDRALTWAAILSIASKGLDITADLYHRTSGAVYRSGVLYETAALVARPLLWACLGFIFCRILVRAVLPDRFSKAVLSAAVFIELLYMLMTGIFLLVPPYASSFTWILNTPTLHLIPGCMAGLSLKK